MLDNDLFARARSFSGPATTECACPIGGIGTGTVSLCGNGSLAEFQLFHRPDQQTMPGLTGFALRCADDRGTVHCRLLEGPVPTPWHRHQRKAGASVHPGLGLGTAGLPGWPRMQGTTFHLAYPFVGIDYHHDDLPLAVSLEAYNPLIPLAVDASSLPCAIFRFTIHNRSDRHQSIDLAAHLRNPFPRCGEQPRRNRAVTGDGWRGLCFDAPGLAEGDPRQGSFCLATPHNNGWQRRYWYDLSFMHACENAYQEFHDSGRLADNDGSDHPAHADAVGTLGLHADLAPGERITLPIWYCWHLPTAAFRLGVANHIGQAEADGAHTWPAWYARPFADATAVAEHLAAQEADLHTRSRQFRLALAACQLDDAVLDRASASLIALRSPTCFRLADGTFYGYEGSGETEGSCPGTCGHVWAYAQAPALLFPSLQRSVHQASFRYQCSPSGSGAMAFRQQVPLRPLENVPAPAVDAQCGEVIKVYQQWRLGAGAAWLQALWPGLRAAMAYAWSWWDHQQRGVIEGIHHNTYDVDFWGPDPMATSYYLGALAACAAMARACNDEDFATTCDTIRARGCAAMADELWNGRYFVQTIDPEAWRHSETERQPYTPRLPVERPDEPREQIGPGCLSDQLAGESLARSAGLETGLDQALVRQALAAIVDHNLKQGFDDHPCLQRVYALGDDEALLLCSWPDGGRPVFPMPYCDEAAWTGIEYQVAAHCLRSGLDDQALRIVAAIAARHDGIKRNPCNEFECGSWYARSLAGWGLVFAGADVLADAVDDCLHVGRAVEGRHLWLNDRGWGWVQLDGDACSIHRCAGDWQPRRVVVAGQERPFTCTEVSR